MRFLSVNHLRLGRSPVGIPSSLSADTRTFSSRLTWRRVVDLAIREEVHALILSGETISSVNSELEPWGPLVDGLTDLHRAGIPVLGIQHGHFTPTNLNRFSGAGSLIWLEDVLDWDPPITTQTGPLAEPAVHIVPRALAEREDAPAPNPITLDQMDLPGSVWLLTDPVQPDQVMGSHALVIESGAVSALSAHETGHHGAWLVDTDSREAHLLPLASIEFASVDIDITDAVSPDDLEHTIASSLVSAAMAARNDGSVAEVLVADATISGTSRIYHTLADTTEELRRMLQIEHDGITIVLSRVVIDATPQIDLQPLLDRPDPVGEVARLINALDTGEGLSEAQAQLLTAAEQKLLTISHARVFGSIVDLEADADAATLLQRQGWATLDALVRQRGID